jgi:hypothetical protein
MPKDKNTDAREILQAREDAAKDMEAEGLCGENENENENGIEDEGVGEEEDSLISDILEQARFQFVASYMVYNRDTGDHEHGIVKHFAECYEEAVGKMYLELTQEFEYEHGWTPPHLMIDDHPVAILPGMAVALGFCTSPDVGEPPCPTCGDPEGPCDEPDTCIQNPYPRGQKVEEEGDKED